MLNYRLNFFLVWWHLLDATDNELVCIKSYTHLSLTLITTYDAVILPFVLFKKYNYCNNNSILEISNTNKQLLTIIEVK